MHFVERDCYSSKSQQELLGQVGCDDPEQLTPDQEPQALRIHPYRYPAAGSEQSGQLHECLAGVRRVVENTDAVDEVEALLFEGKSHDVGLVDANVAAMPEIRSCSNDSLA